MKNSRLARAGHSYDLESWAQAHLWALTDSSKQKAQKAEGPAQFAGQRATAPCSGPELSTSFWKRRGVKVEGIYLP